MSTLTFARVMTGDCQPSEFSLANLLCALRSWRQRARTRRHLLNLDTRGLKDIGITCEDALLEARKPFWQE